MDALIFVACVFGLGVCLAVLVGVVMFVGAFVLTILKRLLR
jgi:hypothetical protein